MKLSILIPSLEKGGIERSISRVSKGLLGLGWEIELLVEKFSSESVSYFDDRVSIVKFKAGSFNQNSNIVFSVLKNAILFFKMITYLNRSNTDVMLVAKNAPLGVFLKKFSRSSFKLVIREAVNPTSASRMQRSLISRLVLNSIKKNSYPLADKIIAISKGVKESMVDYLYLNPDLITVIYNPAADKNVKKLSKIEVPAQYKKGKLPTIISIGRLTPQKDHMTLIKAYELLVKNLDSRLLIIGEGQERKNLERYINERGLSENVLLLGYQSNPWKFLVNSDVFVLSSIWEGFGNVLVESMYLGVPVISSDCESGPREILDGGELGHLFKVGDFVGLSAIIKSTLTESEKHQKVIGLAKRKSKEYTVANITTEYNKVFMELV